MSEPSSPRVRSKRALNSVLMAVCLSFTVSACGFFEPKRAYVESGEIAQLKVPEGLDPPGFDPSLSVPPSSNQRLLAGAELAPPPLGSSGPPGSALQVIGSGKTSLSMADDVDNGWRRVGLALERSGAFTMLERDRESASYRLGLPAPTVRDDRSWWQRTVGWGEAPVPATASEVSVRLLPEGTGVRVDVLDDDGSVLGDDRAQRVIAVIEQRLGLG